MKWVIPWSVAACLALSSAACGPREPTTRTETPDAPEPALAGAVFESPLAGQWYPADATKLRRLIQQCLDAAGGPRCQPVQALILPHAGYRWSGEVTGHGIRQIKGGHYVRAVVIGPSHSVYMENTASLPTASRYRTPLGDIPLDRPFIEALLRHDCFQQVPSAHEHEHSVQSQLPWLQEALGPFELVPIVVGHLNADTTQRMAAVLRNLISRETLVVASTDFTHYGARFSYIPFQQDVEANLRALDMGAWQYIADLDKDGFREYCRRTGATVCGRDAVGLLLALLPRDAQWRLLRYDTSGRISNDFSHSVSYISAAAIGTWSRGRESADGSDAGRLTPEDGAALLSLARDTLDFYYQNGRVPSATDLDLDPSPAMQIIAASFVTLTKRGRLRGCIGSIAPLRPLYQDVMVNAICAATRDCRFPPVAQAELTELTLEVSALSPPLPIDSIEEIELGRHGIILRKGFRSAVYLPQVAPEQGWDRALTLGHLSVKAGLDRDAWRHGARFEVFETEMFAESDQPKRPASTATGQARFRTRAPNDV